MDSAGDSDGFGAAQFNIDGIVAPDEAMFENHMEFLVPHLYRMRMPRPSKD
jgi:hypothetical protein